MAMRDKRACMLITYVKKIISHPEHEYIFAERINKNFIKKGWSISYLFNKFQLSTSISIDWISTIFSPQVSNYLMMNMYNNDHNTDTALITMFLIQ